MPDGVQVFDAEGAPVASSAAVTGSELAVSLTEQVGPGTLVVVWRVRVGGRPSRQRVAHLLGRRPQRRRHAPARRLDEHDHGARSR